MIFGVEFPAPKRIAVVGARAPKKPVALDGIQIISIDALMYDIKNYVRTRSPMSEAVPEGFSHLRAVQFAVWFGNEPTVEGGGKTSGAKAAS